MYQVEEKDNREVFSVYYHEGDMLCITYITAYTQEEANEIGIDRGLSVVEYTCI